MGCKEWKLRIMFSKRISNLDELADYLLDSFASDKLVMLILDKVLLLLDNPFKYSREKLGKDKNGNSMFSIEVTGDIRILYSVDSKNCIVFIWEVGSHKKVYGLAFSLALFNKSSLNFLKSSLFSISRNLLPYLSSTILICINFSQRLLK